VEVRDTVIARMAAAGPGGGLSHDAAATGPAARPSDTNHQYALMKLSAADAAGAPAPTPGGLAAVAPAAHEALLSMGRSQPRYERNSARVCTFFARGECTRGAACPYRHEAPRDASDPLAKQNYKDRCVDHGVRVSERA